MDRVSALVAGSDKRGFEVLEPDKAPDELTRELLWDLWDIGVKFGKPQDRGLGFKSSPLFLVLYDFRGNGAGGIAGLFVEKARPGQNFVSTSAGVFMFELRNGMQVIWGRGLSVDDIRLVIQEVDQYAEQEGYITEGKRQMIDTDS